MPRRVDVPAYRFEPRDLPRVQALIRLGAEVHGGIEELCDGSDGGLTSPRGLRRVLAGDVDSRNLSPMKMHSLLRELWRASLLISADPALAMRCRDAVLGFMDRALLEVGHAREFGTLDAEQYRAREAAR